MKYSTGEQPWWFRLAGGRGAFDTVVVCAYTLVTAAVVLGTGSVPLRVALGLPFLLFAPGYSLVLVMYPGRPESGSLVSSSGVSGIERAALSFGMSLALLPLLGFAVWLLGGGFDAVTAVAVVSVTTLGLVVAGTVRRARLPPDLRFQVPVREWGGRFRAAMTAGGVDGALNVLLTVAVASAVVTAAYVVAVPTDGSTYTGFQLVTETADGGYAATDYPTDLTAGETASLVVGIENHEQQSVRYTVVVELQRVTTDDGSTTVQSSSELQRLQASVDDGATRHLEHEVTPSMTGEDLRLTYYLYRGDAPSDPSEGSAYRTLSLWVDVSGDGQAALAAR